MGRGFKGLSASYSKETEKGHGRVETRRATVLRHVSLLRDAAAWPGLSCIVQVECVRRVGDETGVERRWYICSAAPQRDKELARACRPHWGVEKRVALGRGETGCTGAWT